MIDKELIFSFSLFAILFIGGGYLGWWVAGEDWTLRGILAFAGAFIGSCVWFIVMLARGIWYDYKERQ